MKTLPTTCILSLGLCTISANAALVSGVTAISSYSTASGNRTPSSTVDSSGLNASPRPAVPGSWTHQGGSGEFGGNLNWLAFAATTDPLPGVENHWIAFDLGETVPLGSMNVFNFGVSTGGNNARGVNQGDIYYRSDSFGNNTDNNNTLFDNTGWTLLGPAGAQTFDIGPTDGLFQGATNVPLGISARYVAIDINSSHGDTELVGLGEVQFFTPAGPPTLAGSDIVDNQGGGPVSVNALVTYTVTFSKDIDESTVSDADFDNAGTADIDIDSVDETAPGVFSVRVVPTTLGTLQLRVPVDASITDIAGDPLDNDPAIVDDTTITVIPGTTAPTLTISSDADSYLDQFSSTMNFGTEDHMWVKRSAPFNRKAIMRFDLASLPFDHTTDLEGASLKLNFIDSGAGTGGDGIDWVFEVYGLNDGDPGEAWDETTIDWNNAPQNDPGDAVLGGATSLGTFNFIGKTATVDFSGGTAVQDFVAASSSDDLVTFYVVRITAQPDGGNSYIHAISSKEHSVGAAAPELEFEAITANRYQFQVRGVGGDLEFSWNSFASDLYDILTTTDPEANPDPNTWDVFIADIASTPDRNTETAPRPGDPERYFVLSRKDPPPVFLDDFESGQGSWVNVNDDGNNNTVWELGMPSGAGPATGAGGSANCFGTNIGADYSSDAAIRLQSPPIDLTGAGGGRLTFDQFKDIETTFDDGNIRVLDAADDSLIGADIAMGIEGTSADWEAAKFALPPEVAGKVIKIEFEFLSDNMVNQAGWYIDNVAIHLAD